MAHADALARLIKGMHCRVNLIRFHAIPDVELRTATEHAMTAFRDRLNERGITATIRASRGEDIMAACGMLAGKERGPGLGVVDAVGGRNVDDLHLRIREHIRKGSVYLRNGKFLRHGAPGLLPAGADGIDLEFTAVTVFSQHGSGDGTGSDDSKFHNVSSLNQ
jgi:hypothetical protein